MTEEPFFVPQGDAYLPNPICRGPWDPKSLNGRVVAGLIGCVAETRHGGDGWVPARMTVDMYRLPGFDPVTIESRVIREGRRIKVIDVEFISAGKSQARGVFQFLKQGENSAGDVWTPPAWEVPGPDAASKPDEWRHRMWEMRPIAGGMGQEGPRQTWLREIREMVEGTPVTPFSRVAAACDFASPFANSGTAGLGYINTDITLSLHRLPRGEWVGFESHYHGADAGVAVGQCRLYDEEGAIGLGTCLALAQMMPQRPR